MAESPRGPESPKPAIDIADKSEADILKDEGNELFKKGKFADAVLKYNDAIDADPEKPAFYTNRAFCHLKMENHGLCIADSTTAIELDKTFIKAYYRRGSSYMGLGKYKDAMKDFKVARQLKPSDRDALEKFKAAEKEVKREAFERAIHSDEPSRECLADTLSASVDTLPVDASYSGPQPNFPLQLDDVRAIAEHMKQQKSLHSKYVHKILIELRNQLKELPSCVDVPIPEGTRINVRPARAQPPRTPLSKRASCVARKMRAGRSHCSYSPLCRFVATRTGSTTICSTSSRSRGGRRRTTLSSSTATLSIAAPSPSRSSCCSLP